MDSCDDFSKFKENCEIDRKAVEALGLALAGSNRPLVVTSGTGLLPRGILGTEDQKPLSGPNALPRVASEEAAASVAARGVRVAVVRLPPSVHGDGDHGFVPMLIGLAREKGVSAYIGEGLNRWPAVHRFDAARLFRLVFEKAPAGASMFHGAAEEGVAFRQIAEVIGKQLKMPVVSKSSDEAAAHFTWFAHFAALDNPSSSQKTQKRLSWRPTHQTLLADLDKGNYFKS